MAQDRRIDPINTPLDQRSVVPTTSHGVPTQIDTPQLSFPSPVDPALVQTAGVETTAEVVQQVIALEKQKSEPSRWSSLLTVVTGNPKMLFGLCIVAFFLIIALIGPWITPQDPTNFSNDLFQSPSASHWLGTSQKGEDVFSQLVAGTRLSLIIGFTASIGATALSILFGLISGYFAGVADDVLSLLINIFLVLPGLPLAIVIASFSPFKGAGTIIMVLLLTSWPWGARIIRSQTLSMRRREFVEAARAVGESPWRIVFAEIFPNEIALVASSFVGTFVYTVLSEVTLEFLGLGDVSIPSWGSMLFWAQAGQALLVGGWWLFVPPGLCVAILCAGLTFVNYGIDEIANPSLRRERKKARKKEAVA